MEIIDIVNLSEKVTNDLPDVSEGRVIFGKLSWMPSWALETVCCMKHGAMNKVAEGIWRCLECNVGAKERAVLKHE